MYSTASITDFDSDEDNYPYYDSGIGVTHSNSSSNSNSSSDASESCHVHEFGEFEDNHGWIQCRSKSYPDRVYYHNTRSGCNTWYRPVSRYMDIPFVTIRKTNYGTLESANDLELMSVSDDEKESKQIPVRDRDRSLIDAPNASEIIARYQTLQTDLTHNGDLADSIDTSDCCTRKQQAHMNDRNNNVGDSPYATKSERFAEDIEEIKSSWKFSSPRDDTSNVPSFQTERVIYGVPRLKRIGLESQLIKPRRTRVVKSREEPGPRKIVCDMYGVRTVSYDLPEPDQVCATVGVKMSTLSESDSDKSVPPSPSRRAETTRSFESQWRDIERNLHQPLLSDSSSTSSRSDTTTSSSGTSRSTGSSTSGSSSSSSGSSNSSSSSCSCSSCSRKV